MPIVSGVFNYMWMLLWAAVPLFIFIGVALSKTKIAEDLFNAFYLWSGSVRGGLAVGSCCLAAALSAMTGNNAASTVTTGLVGIPPMKQRGYKESIILGAIGGPGTMGILIPPSITLIVIGMMTGQSIGKLFAGGMTSGLFIVFTFHYLYPHSGLARSFPVSCHWGPGHLTGKNLRPKIYSLSFTDYPLHHGDDIWRDCHSH